MPKLATEVITDTTSLFDDDFYKITMLQGVLAKCPDAIMEAEFINRGPHRFNRAFLDALRTNIDRMARIRATKEELEWLSQIKFFQPWLISEVECYRYQPDQVYTDLTEDNNLILRIKGPWRSTILWEVKLLWLISELYFRMIATDWTMDGYRERLLTKAESLAPYHYACFGARRRRSYDVQDLVVGTLTGKPGFVGTSNMHLAMKHRVRPIGTMAHEWIMAHSAILGLRHANRYALDAWASVYRGNLGIALTDTFGLDAFLEDFDLYLAKLFDGVRHDSGDPIGFATAIIRHYQKLGIDPMTKTIVFSDALNVQTCLHIAQFCLGKINFSFGIGTNLSNDWPDALNMVIKARRFNGIDVVKLSDTPTKAIGARDALRVARYTFLNTPLDTTT